jgi:hypothetical protein
MYDSLDRLRVRSGIRRSKIESILKMIRVYKRPRVISNRKRKIRSILYTINRIEMNK